MTKTITIGLVAIAFVAGSILTGTMAYAGGGDDNGGNAIVDALNQIAIAIQGIDPTVNVDPTPVNVNVDPTPITVNAPQGPQGEQGPQGIPDLPGAEGAMGPQGESFTQVVNTFINSGFQTTDRVECTSTADFLVYVVLFVQANGDYGFASSANQGSAPQAAVPRVDSFVLGGDAGDEVAIFSPNFLIGTITLQTTDSAVASCMTS